MSASDLLDAYQALARRAWDTNRARSVELSAVLAEWQQSGTLADDQRERARVVAHSLRGSAGTFGHAEAAESAGELQELLSAEGAPSIDVVASLVGRIETALEQDPVLEL